MSIHHSFGNLSGSGAMFIAVSTETGDDGKPTVAAVSSPQVASDVTISKDEDADGGFTLAIQNFKGRHGRAIPMMTAYAPPAKKPNNNDGEAAKRKRPPDRREPVTAHRPLCRYDGDTLLVSLTVADVDMFIIAV